MKTKQSKLTINSFKMNVSFLLSTKSKDKGRWVCREGGNLLSVCSNVKKYGHFWHEYNCSSKNQKYNHCMTQVCHSWGYMNRTSHPAAEILAHPWTVLFSFTVVREGISLIIISRWMHNREHTHDLIVFIHKEKGNHKIHGIMCVTEELYIK